MSMVNQACAPCTVPVTGSVTLDDDGSGNVALTACEPRARPLRGRLAALREHRARPRQHRARGRQRRGHGLDAEQRRSRPDLARARRHDQLRLRHPHLCEMCSESPTAPSRFHRRSESTSAPGRSTDSEDSRRPSSTRRSRARIRDRDAAPLWLDDTDSGAGNQPARGRGADRALAAAARSDLIARVPSLRDHARNNPTTARRLARWSASGGAAIR